MNSLSLRSPAKLNLFLRVVNKRKDGYHNIITLFERISLCDEISFRLNKTGAIRISCHDPQVPTDSKNLVYKVAKLLQKDFVLKKGVDIKIKKRIPVAAGLGGGSSNAATALIGLNKIWGLKLNQRKLLTYAKKVGSDVPFFIYQYSWALGTQRGDEIKKVNLGTKLWHLLIVPRVKMLTKRVYQGLKLQLTKKHEDVNILIHYLRFNRLNKISDCIINDLETSILVFCPKLKSLKKQLKEFDTQGVAFSGSGPSVFCIVLTKNEAERLKKAFQKRYNRVFVVSTF